MKRIILLLFSGTLGSFIGLDCALAQTPATLSAQVYMGLQIDGAVGTVYGIQLSTNLSQTDGWTCLSFVQLPTTNYLWFDATAPAAGQRFYRAVTLAPGDLVFIPPGAFRMGSPTNELDRFSDEGPQAAVTLTKGFYMSKYLVTQENYAAVVGSNPSFFTSALNLPVEQVSWNDATNYCALRTQQEIATGRIPAGCRYRLPTEAEWEYACRAWTSDRRLHYGDDPGYPNLGDYAWYSANSGNGTHPVGQKRPNAWGLYDMAGNVWVWCQDWYGTYSGGSVTDPRGPDAGASRVLRGGGWSFDARFCRSAQRSSSSPAFTSSLVGLRVVLVPNR
jgi:formylglycine-generating enzyme required for sulfatase activity